LAVLQQRLPQGRWGSVSQLFDCGLEQSGYVHRITEPHKVDGQRHSWIFTAACKVHEAPAVPSFQGFLRDQVFRVALQLSVCQAMIPLVLDDDGRWARWTAVRQQYVEPALSRRRELGHGAPPAVRRWPRRSGSAPRKMVIDQCKKGVQERTSLAVRTSGIEEVAKQRRMRGNLKPAATCHRKDIERTAGGAGLPDCRLQRVSNAGEHRKQFAPCPDSRRLLGARTSSKSVRRALQVSNPITDTHTLLYFLLQVPIPVCRPVGKHVLRRWFSGS
jgi:hypothetical protein